MTENHEKPTEKLAHAYNTMMERIHELMEHAGEGAHTLQTAIEKAREKAVELGELTREEAEEIGTYLKRDMEEAGNYLADTGKDMGDWLHMDMELIELKLLDMFTSVADKTRLDMEKFEEEVKAASEYHAGEITGPGTLECKNCGEVTHFTKTAHIPPCSQCHGNVYYRKTK